MVAVAIAVTWVYATINGAVVASQDLIWHPQVNCVFSVVTSPSVRIAIAAQIIIICLIIAVLYIFIFKAVKVQRQKIAQHQSGTIGTQNDLHDFLHILKTYTIVVGIFMACWLSCAILLLTSIGGNDVSMASYSANAILVSINSAMNPIIYCWRMAPFRQALKLRCCKVAISPE